MKILFITNMYPSQQKAYAGIFVKNQFEQLNKIIDDKDTLDIFYMKRVFTSKIGSVLKYLFAFIRFIPFLFRRYDIIHVHYFYPLILLAWLNKKIYKSTKIVVTFLGRDINSQIDDSNQKFFRKIARKIDFSIPVGLTLAEQIKKKLDLRKMKVLPCGVKESVFYKETDIEKKYDFIMVGSFIHRKGIDTIIEAIKLMPENSNIKFCFCGSGNYLSELEKLQKNHDVTIKQNQTQDQLRYLLNSSRYFLLMSRAEGFATATTEAFFCGVPVLTSDINNFKEQVEEGVNGFLSPLGNAEILKENFLKLSLIKDDRYKELSNGALNSFKDASLNYVCREIYNIYKSLSFNI